MMASSISICKNNHDFVTLRVVNLKFVLRPSPAHRNALLAPAVVPSFRNQSAAARSPAVAEDVDCNQHRRSSDLRIIRL